MIAFLSSIFYSLLISPCFNPLSFSNLGLIFWQLVATFCQPGLIAITLLASAPPGSHAAIMNLTHLILYVSFVVVQNSDDLLEIPQILALILLVRAPAFFGFDYRIWFGISLLLVFYGIFLFGVLKLVLYHFLHYLLLSFDWIQAVQVVSDVGVRQVVIVHLKKLAKVKGLQILNGLACHFVVWWLFV